MSIISLKHAFELSILHTKSSSDSIISDDQLDTGIQEVTY